MPDPMKIVVDVVNSEKVKELTKEIEKQEAAIVKWNAKMASSTVAGKAVLETRMEAAATKIAAARVQIESLEPASIKAGRGLGQLAYALDDIQYGFNAIVNNIPQIAMGLGAGAGIAGAVGIAAIAINQLIKHWGELSDIAQSMWAGNSLEQLQQLREKAEAAADAFDKLSDANRKQEAAAKGMGALIEEGPKAEILRKTAEAIAADPLLQTKPKIIRGKKGGKTDKALQAFLDQLGIGDFFPEVGDVNKNVPAQQQAANKAAQEQNFENAKQLLGAAAQGDPQAMLKLEALVARHPGAFPDEFMQDIKNQTPEGKKRIEEQRHQAEHDRIARKEDQKFEENKAKEAKKARIEGLEDERQQIQKAQRDFDEQMWQKQYAATQQQGQMFSGAKSFIDYYHGASTGADDPKALAKQAHEQRKKTNDLLEDIDKQMKKERRLVVPT